MSGTGSHSQRQSPAANLCILLTQLFLTISHNHQRLLVAYGDEELIRSVWLKLERLLQFTRKFIDGRGLVVAPPPLSSKFDFFAVYVDYWRKSSGLVPAWRSNIRSFN
jgi:hypothetical protein